MQIQQKAITSMEVATMVEKDHNKLLRDIRTYTEQLGQSKIGHSEFFKESTYQSEQNKTLPCYLVTKKGCEFIAHKLTGIKGTEFTAKYINRFHDMEEEIKKPKTEIEILQESLQILSKQDLRISKLENNMTIDHGQAQDLRQAGAKRVLELCGGKQSNAYKELSKKVFAELWHDFKEFYHINAYSNTLVLKFDEALSYVEQWTPSNNMLIRIRNCNNQINLAV